MSKEVLAGAVGGLIGAGLVRLTTPPPKKIISSKQVINKQTLAPGAGASLVQLTRFKFAIILIHGDGDPQVTLEVTRDETSTVIQGNEQAIEVLADETIVISASNTDPYDYRSIPTIEIISLSW
jgi:hypothetical protein